MRKLLLIDYENIQNFDLTCLENNVDVVQNLHVVA